MPEIETPKPALPDPAEVVRQRREAVEQSLGEMVVAFAAMSPADLNYKHPETYQVQAKRREAPPPVTKNDHPQISRWGLGALNNESFGVEEGTTPHSLLNYLQAKKMYRQKKKLNPLKASLSVAEEGVYAINGDENSPLRGLSNKRIDGSLRHLSLAQQRPIKKEERGYAKNLKKQQKVLRTLTHSGAKEARKQPLYEAKRFNRDWLIAGSEVPEPTIEEIGTASPLVIAWHGLRARVAARRAWKAGEKADKLEAAENLTPEIASKIEAKRAQRFKLQRQAQTHRLEQNRLNKEKKPVDLSGWLSTVPSTGNSAEKIIADGIKASLFRKPYIDYAAVEALTDEQKAVLSESNEGRLLASRWAPTSLPNNLTAKERNLHYLTTELRLRKLRGESLADIDKLIENRKIEKEIFSLENIDPQFHSLLTKENLSALYLATEEELQIAGSAERKALGITDPNARIPEADWAPIRDPIVAKRYRDYIDSHVGKDQDLPLDIQRQFERRLRFLFNQRRS